MLKKYSLSLLFLLTLVSCKNENFPFYNVLTSLESRMSKQELEDFAKTSQERPIYNNHFKYLLKYNNDVFSNKMDTSIIVYFHSKGIYKVGDMSDILFISLHRKLNSKKIDLEKQIKDKIDYYNASDECEKLQDETLVSNEKFIKGDTIQVRMRINMQDNCAYPIDCLNMEKDWKFDDNKDLLITGVVLGKYKYDSNPKFVYMNMKIIDLNKNNIPVPRKLLKKGEEFSVVLNYDIIEHSK